MELFIVLDWTHANKNMDYQQKQELVSKKTENLNCTKGNCKISESNPGHMKTACRLTCRRREAAVHDEHGSDRHYGRLRIPGDMMGIHIGMRV